jgi:crotonobetainyl-CoA:carnitine CoA-transferase CaiB-like acyl-CoA transferase
MDSDNPILHGPLAGVCVLDLSQVLAGPYATLLLANMGADIIKIERPPAGDLSRQIPPLVGDESIYFLSANSNKRSIMLDLKQPAGLQVFYDLVRQADVVLDNFRPGVTKRLGIDYPKLNEINPQIIACSITAFGQDGPYQNRPGFDIVFQAMSGAISVTGEADRPPVRTSVPIGDLGGGLFMALSILAALFEQSATQIPKRSPKSQATTTFTWSAHPPGVAPGGKLLVGAN